MNPKTFEYESLFENISDKVFKINDQNTFDKYDLDKNFIDNFSLMNMEKPYMFPDEINKYLKDVKPYESLSLVHLNIRSAKANFENFKIFLEESNFIFNIICLGETWLTDDEFNENTLFKLNNHEGVHLQRKSKKRGGGVVIYIKNSLRYKLRNDLCTSDYDREFVSIEIINNDSKNTLISCYFNLNALNYENNIETQSFYNNLFQIGVIPLINKPTRITKNSATLIDNILTNSLFEISLKKGVIKTFISDHFPIFISISTSNKIKINEKKTITRRHFSLDSQVNFKKEGIFPEKLKTAKVKPIFKSGDTSEIGNYRPISILSTFSKILERIMHNRVYIFFKENNFIYSKQFGFQKNTSAEHAILHLVDEIKNSFTNGEVTLGVFIDLSKAFDTVDHKILLSKLNMYGIRGRTNKLIESYFDKRVQSIYYGDNKLSNPSILKCGVPLGSILGPLLFLIYVNDLYWASKRISTIMFADDSNFFISGKIINELCVEMNQE
ncbi:uncharacterized protein LOC136074619 [Hydra vulgaris]|uniref:Uncharacterized protein LOC136074619 n=1 Tax=Hydra vulgaris TaxID=6087 RepID=A0ABM4B2K3_HYDVU